MRLADELIDVKTSVELCPSSLFKVTETFFP